MSFWNKLFGRKTDNLEDGAATKPSTGQAALVDAKRGGNWYFAEDESRVLRQVVLMSDPQRTTKSHFSSPMFTPLYRHLMNGPLTTGFFRLDHDPGPYLMIRTDGLQADVYAAVDEMVKYPFLVAISFCHLPTSGLIAVFVSGKFLKDNTRMGYLEMLYGLDRENARSLISDALTKDALQVVHASESGGMVRCKYEIEIRIDSTCRRALADNWNAILAHHKKILNPDFAAAGRRLYELIPEGSDPIISYKAGDNASHTTSARPTHARVNVKTDPETDKILWQKLIEQFKEGNLETVQKLLRDNADLVFSKGTDDMHGLTLLHYAAFRRQNDEKLVQLLLANGADVNARNDWGETPLHVAALSGNTTVAELLLDNGAKVDARDKDGYTPLVCWSTGRFPEPDTAILLLKKGANPNEKTNDSGRTILHYAAARGQTDVVQLMLAKGAEVNAKDNDGRTPLDAAGRMNRPRVMDLLRRGGGRKWSE